MRAFPVVVAGVGGGRYASTMDPVYFPILSAIIGGVIGAAVNQWLTHRRTMADRAEAVRVVQRDAAGALIAAAQEYAWGLQTFRTDLDDEPSTWEMGADAYEKFADAHRRFQVALNRARMAVVEPEARQIVSDLHQAFRAMYADAPIDGVTLETHTDWMRQLETMLYDHGKRLLEVGIRNLRPGGPPRRSRLPWRKESDHAAGGAHTIPGGVGGTSGTSGTSPVKDHPGTTARAAK